MKKSVKDIFSILYSIELSSKFSVSLATRRYFTPGLGRGVETRVYIKGAPGGSTVNRVRLPHRPHGFEPQAPIFSSAHELHLHLSLLRYMYMHICITNSVFTDEIGFALVAKKL